MAEKVDPRVRRVLKQRKAALDWLGRTPLSRLVKLEQAGRLPPSLMFVGPPGALLLPAALELAAVINSPDRDPESKATREIAERIWVTAECLRNPLPKNSLWPGPGGGPYRDVRVLYPEGAGRQIKIDPVRFVTDAARMRPFEGRRRVLIIESADAIASPAASAMLKELEEPNNEVLRWILCAERPAALPSTIVSRCQRWIFPAPTPAEVVEGLRRDRDFEVGIAEIATAASQAHPARAAGFRRDRLRGFQEEAERLATVAGQGIGPQQRNELTRKLGKLELDDDLTPILNLLRATLRDLAALASGVPPLSFPSRRKGLAKVAALAPPGAWAQASLHARESHNRMVLTKGHRRMQLEWLLLQFNDIARPLEIARRNRQKRAAR